MRRWNWSTALMIAVGLAILILIIYAWRHPAPPEFNPSDATMVPLASAAACVAPPLLTHSVAPSTTLTYRILGFSSDDVCIRRAFDVWSESLQELSISFVYEPNVSRSTDLVVYRGPLPDETGGGITPITRRADGYLRGTGILITNNRQLVSSCLGIYKVALHEIGHVLGLGHPRSVHESSVMNNMRGLNDANHDIPVRPTTCDIAQVHTASAMPRGAVPQY